LHGENKTYYFHNGAASNDAAQLIWGTKTYWRLPIEAEGFEYKGGKTVSLPRPTLRISNLFGTISSILLDVNETTVGNDLTGAKLTRLRTLAKFLDFTNFGSDDFLAAAEDETIFMENEDTISLEHRLDPSSPDTTQEFPREIYYVDRKVIENRDICEFELASAFDLAGVRIPKRQCLPADFPGIGTFHV
jgi:phage-related protein